jgi:hypothetical protein
MQPTEGDSIADPNLVLRGAERAMEIAVERYNELSGLRALLSLIPGVGGALDLLISGEGTRIQQRRLMRLLEGLRFDLALLEASKLDEDFIRRDEFFDWFSAAAERFVRTGNEVKQEALRRVFVFGITIPGSSDPLKELVLRIVSDLSWAHIATLRVVSDGIEADAAPTFEPADLSVQGLTRRELDIVLDDLVSLGLVNRATPGGIGNGMPSILELSPFGEHVNLFLRGGGLESTVAE